MRLVVIGRDGQVGRCLQDAAAAEPDIELVALGRPEVDLDVPATLRAGVADHGADVVINAAAYTAVDAAEQDVDAAFRRNADAPAALAAACAERNVPLIHLSTDYVFDGAAGRPYREDDVARPLNVYGRSKAAGEAAVASALEPHVIVRTAWVFSAYGHNFVKTMLRLAGERDRLGVVVDQRGSPTYAPHLARFLLVAARRAGSAAPPPWGIYHATSSGDATWHGLATEVVAAAAAHGRPRPAVDPIPTTAYPTPAPRPADTRLDNTKMIETFAAPLPPWRAGVGAAVAALVAA